MECREKMRMISIDSTELIHNELPAIEGNTVESVSGFQPLLQEGGTDPDRAPSLVKQQS